MPGDSGGPVVATLVCHHHTLRTRLRVQRAPGIPHALCWAKGSCTTRALRAAGMRSCVGHQCGCLKIESVAISLSVNAPDSRASVIESRSCGVLDAQLSRSMTGL